jgi:S1-C subfamily serine protease
MSSSSLVDFSHELANTVERAGSSVISVLEGGRSGVSGTIWQEGTAITIAHTIQGLEEVTVVLPSGDEIRAAVASRDAGTDIAVLKLGTGAKAATWKYSSTSTEKALTKGPAFAWRGLAVIAPRIVPPPHCSPPGFSAWTSRK